MQSKNQIKNNTTESMSFSDHLEELRQRIINSILAILISILRQTDINYF